MPTLYLSPLQRLRNLFHLFCKQQLEQSQVVFSVVLSCHSSGKSSKEQGNKVLEIKAEDTATPILCSCTALLLVMLKEVQLFCKGL